jgi:hypothetical protein
VDEEQSALSAFRKRLFHYCLLEDSYQINRVHILDSLSEWVDVDTTKVELVHIQEYCALYDKHLQSDQGLIEPPKAARGHATSIVLT